MVRVRVRFGLGFISCGRRSAASAASGGAAPAENGSSAWSSADRALAAGPRVLGPGVRKRVRVRVRQRVRAGVRDRVRVRVRVRARFGLANRACAA